MPSPQTGHDRRSHPRMKLALPVVLFRSGELARIETRTENISCDSFYCLMEQPFTPDDRLECEILLAGNQWRSVLEDELCLNCRVRVIRVVREGLQPQFGVAFRIEEYY